MQQLNNMKHRHFLFYTVFTYFSAHRKRSGRVLQRNPGIRVNLRLLSALICENPSSELETRTPHRETQNTDPGTRTPQPHIHQINSNYFKASVFFVILQVIVRSYVEHS